MHVMLIYTMYIYFIQTAQSMTFLLYQLARNPDKQERIFRELEPIIKPKGRLDSDVLQKIPYLKACFRESFRFEFCGFFFISSQYQIWHQLK